MVLEEFIFKLNKWSEIKIEYISISERIIGIIGNGYLKFML